MAGVEVRPGHSLQGCRQDTGSVAVEEQLDHRHDHQWVAEGSNGRQDMLDDCRRAHGPEAANNQDDRTGAHNGRHRLCIGPRTVRLHALHGC